MAEVALDTEGAPPPPRRLRSDWPRRLLNELFALLVALLLLLAGALVLLDSAPGHRFIVDRLGKLETSSGLRIQIGRIDGSIFGVSQLRNVRVSDPQGVFLTSPNIKLDWTPGAWLRNKLHIDHLTAERVSLTRLPKTRPSLKKGPILPSFDIQIGELRIDRLDVGPAIGGTPRSGRVQGKADIHSGRALVELAALINNGGDRIAFRLDAEPDRDKFDVDARVISPANGLVPALAGIRRPINLTIAGDGSWTRWRGNAALDLSGRPTLRLALGVDQGRYRLAGKWAPAQFLKGRLLQLTAPVVNIEGQGTLEDSILDGQLAVGSAALRAVAKGAIDLNESRYRELRLGIDLMKPPALFPNMTGRGVRMVWTLDGPFATADYSYRLTSQGVKFDDVGLVQFRAEGRGRLSPWPMRVPIRLSARAITGIGDEAGAMLANPRIEGWLSFTPKMVRGDGLKLTSAKWNGKISLLIDLVTGHFQVQLSGRMQRYLIPGLGIVDVMTDLKVVPGPGGHGSTVVGTAKAWVRRLDNSFFRDLTGGLPRLETNYTRGNDGIVRFSNLQFYSPALRLSGFGQRNRDGTFHIVASGRQAKYGQLKLILDGDIARPRVDLLLASPNEGLGLRAVRLLLSPIAAGFDYRASGGSKLGPFTSNGQILLPNNAPTVIAIAALDVGGAHASGRLRSDPGGFFGRLLLARGSLNGTLDFSPVSGAQRIDAHLIASNANFPGALAVREGRADGSIILADQRTTIDGSVEARGLTIGGMTLARLTANARLVNGVGQVHAAFAGRRGAAFAFSTVADISPDTIRVTGSGRVRARAFGAQRGRGVHPLGRRLGSSPNEPRLRGRNRDRLRPQRFAPRSACAGPGHAPSGARPRLAEPRPRREGYRPPRLCLEGQSCRPSRSQGARPQPRWPGPHLAAGRRRCRRGRDGE